VQEERCDRDGLLLYRLDFWSKGRHEEIAESLKAIEERMRAHG
jgi:hypothetical protein